MQPTEEPLECIYDNCTELATDGGLMCDDCRIESWFHAQAGITVEQILDVLDEELDDES